MTAPISFIITSPCGNVIGNCLLTLSCSRTFLSFLKSNLVPTNIIGVFGRWCLTSGYHFLNLFLLTINITFFYKFKNITLIRIFSNEFGSTIEKQIKNMSWNMILNQLKYYSNNLPFVDMIKVEDDCILLGLPLIEELEIGNK